MPLVGSTQSNMTFVDGVEILFQNGIAKVTKEQKKKLLKRTGDGYYDPDHITPDQAMNKGGVSTLETIFRKEVEKGELPALRAWLHEKISEVEPALLTMQQQQSQQMVEAGNTNPPAILEDDDDDDDEEGEVMTVDGGSTEIALPDGTTKKLSDFVEEEADDDDDEEEEEVVVKKKSKKKKKKKKKS